MIAGSARGRKNMLSDVVGECTEGLVWRAVRICSFGEARMKSFDRLTNGVGSFLGDTVCSRHVFLLIGVDGFEFAEGFLFDGIGLIFVVEDLFEFELFAE